MVVSARGLGGCGGAAEPVRVHTTLISTQHSPGEGLGRLFLHARGLGVCSTHQVVAHPPHPNRNPFSPGSRPPLPLTPHPLPSDVTNAKIRTPLNQNPPAAKPPPPPSRRVQRQDPHPTPTETSPSPPLPPNRTPRTDPPHSDVSNDKIRSDLMEHVIEPVVPAKYLDDNTIFHLNPSGGGGWHFGGKRGWDSGRLGLGRCRHHLPPQPLGWAAGLCFWGLSLGAVGRGGGRAWAIAPPPPQPLGWADLGGGAALRGGGRLA